MESPTSWGSRPPLEIARGKTLVAQLTVRTYRAKKPLAYISINRAGETTFYSAGSCY
jgi:hypothetical protein